MQQINKGLEAMFLYPKEAQRLLGIGTTLFYEIIRLEEFPKPRKVGTAKTGMYLRYELEEWAANTPKTTAKILTREE